MLLNFLRGSALLGICVILLSSCDIALTADNKGISAELTRNKALWENGGHKSYTFQYSSYGLMPDSGTVYSVQISNNVVASVTNTATNAVIPAANLSKFPTVADLFNYIQDGIDRRAAKITVTYDTSLNFPKTIYIDYDANIADDELNLRASALSIIK